MTVTPDPFAVAERILQALDTLGVRGTIGGSIASSLAGEPRSTIDIDIVAALGSEHAEPLAAALAPAFYVDAAAITRAIAARGTVNLIEHATQIKVDIFVASSSLSARGIKGRRT